MLWDIASAKQLQVFRGHPNIVTVLTFSEGGKAVAGASSRGSRDGPATSIVRYWDVKTGERFRTDTVEEAGTNRALSAKDQLLITILPKRAKVWDLALGREGATLEAGADGCSYACIAADGKTAATAGYSRGAAGFVCHIRLWNPTDGMLRGQFELDKSVDFLTFSPDGKFLAFRSPRDRTFGFWDVEKAKELETKIRYAQGGGAFSIDGKVFAVARTNIDVFEDPKAKRGSVVDLISLSTGKVLAKLEGGRGGEIVLFSPDGRLVATTSKGEGTIWIWNVPKLEQ